MNLMQQLINELNNARYEYYNGDKCSLTDKEFDIKIEQLKKLEKESGIIYANSPTHSVGAPVLNGLEKVTIQNKPMLSLDKVHTAEEIVKFSDGYDLLVSVKCDGLSVRLIYKNGKLISANTRGNGYVGGNITEHIKQFLNVPISIYKEGEYIIDGEAIIYDDDFKIVNKNNEFKNNRNTASGSLTLLDMKEVASRRLSFIAWDVIKGGCSKKECHYNLEEAEEMGFDVVPSFILDCTRIDEEEINQMNNDLIDWAFKEGIPCDGVVWKINDIPAGDAKGQTAHHFLNAVAWKPEDEEYETQLKYINYDTSRTGVLTPVAVFEPIEIDGTVCERASLHNLSVMEDILGNTPYCGQHIWVYKANQIIPQIKRAIKMDYGDIISQGGITTGLGGDYGVLCPVCEHPTSIVTSDTGVKTLICNNEECGGKLLNRLDHFCGKKGLDIKGLSKMTLDKLINWGWVNNFKDILRLQEHKNEWIKKPGFGKASVTKILLNIEIATHPAWLWRVIAAAGIPLIGSTASKVLANKFKTYAAFRKAVEDDFDFAVLPDFGYETKKQILDFDYTEIDEAVWYGIEIQEVKEKEVEKVLVGKKFCITGKLKTFKNRNELKDKIESLGGKVVDTVSKNTDFLINNDIESTSSKNKKAKELSIPILTEEQFLNLEEFPDIV